MSKQPTRRRATRGAARVLAMWGAVAALVGLVGAGQALAVMAVPDERVLERQDMIERQKALDQVDQTGGVAPPPQPSSEDQVAPSPVRTAPAGARGGIAVIVVVAALLLAVGVATTWRVRHRRPQPESTA
jgi:uncharacterized protein HemX